jgi:hypothetical protein
MTVTADARARLGVIKITSFDWIPAFAGMTNETSHV